MRYVLARGCGDAGMQDYRLYCLDGVKRIARAAEVISAPSDEDAVAQVRELRKPTACEIWQGRRLVATIPAAPPDSRD